MFLIFWQRFIIPRLCLFFIIFFQSSIAKIIFLRSFFFECADTKQVFMKKWGQEELNPGPLSPETSLLTTSTTITTALSFGAVILGRWIEFQMTGRSAKSSTLLFTNSRSYVVDTMAKLGHPRGRFKEVFRGWSFCPASPLFIYFKILQSHHWKKKSY